MPRQTLAYRLAAGLILSIGCSSSPRFVQIAPGVAVSHESIDHYAEQHGLSHAEAKRKLAAEMMSSGGAGAAALAGEPAAAAEGGASAR